MRVVKGDEDEDVVAPDLDPDVWMSVTVETDDAATLEEEQLGSKEKFWVRRSGDERSWLFKYARGHGSDVRGEDWAEWIVHKLAQLMGVPSAVITPANVIDRRGVLSRNVVDPYHNERLVHGNERLAQRDHLYDTELKGENPRYSVRAVKEALDGVRPPRDMDWIIGLSGFGVWVGYLVLDALVAGRDRHHENWGIIQSATQAELAPSFDHGNALGFQEPEARVGRLLRSEASLEAWLHRGRSRHFAGRPELVQLAFEGLTLASPQARSHWYERLVLISDLQVSTTVASIPADVMSEVARTLAGTIVRENRRRLLDEYPTG